MNYARELTIIIIIITKKNNRNMNGVSIEGEDITQTIAFQTPGGANNNGSRVPLHSVVVRDFSFLNFEPKFPPFFCSVPFSSQQKTDWLTDYPRWYMKHICDLNLHTNKQTERTDADVSEEYEHGDEEATVDGREELLRRVCV